MITTKFGTIIEFIKLDEWVVQMSVSVPHIKGNKVVASPKFTINALKQELDRLENSKPIQLTPEDAHGIAAAMQDDD